MSNSKNVVAIIGMHRSGTSLTASILQNSGLNIGKNLLKPAKDNKYGFFEDEDFQKFQDEVLAKTGNDYLVHTDKSIAFDGDDYIKAKKLIQKRDKLDVWGWKDPRTTLFLSDWDGLLGDAKYFMVYRHPVEVVYSLLKRGGPRVLLRSDKLFDVWNLYNRKMLEFYKENKDKCVLCNVHGMLQDMEKFIGVLSEKLNLNESPDIHSLYDRNILTHISIPDWANWYLEYTYPNTMSLYDELQHTANIPYYEKDISVEEEIAFVKETMNTFSQVHSKMQSISGAHNKEIKNDQASEVDKEIYNKYKLLEINYNELISSKPVRLARAIKKFPFLDRISRNIYEKVDSTLERNKKIVTGTKSVATKDSEIDRILINSSSQTKYQNDFDEFKSTLQLCFAGMHGVQSAVDYLPGHKIALPMTHSLSGVDTNKLKEYLSKNKIDKIMLHGYWDNIDALLKELKTDFDALDIYSIWHGNTSQFVNEKVYRSFIRLIELKKGQLVKQITSVKFGFNDISDYVFPHIVYNMPPKIDGSSVQIIKNGKKKVFMPLRDIWRKNFYSNYFAAGNHPNVDELVITCKGLNDIDDVNLTIKAKIDLLNSGKGVDRESVFKKIRASDLVMNVTLSECQPMVLLEALSFNTPCLIGPVQMDGMDDHEYKKLVEVNYPDSLECINKHIDAVFHLINKEERSLLGMIEDYKEVVLQQSKNSYLDLMNA